MPIQGSQLRIALKEPVRVASTGSNITFSGTAPDTLDGVGLAVGDRVLLKDQTAPAQNGIYEVITLGTGANGTWARADDFDDVDDDKIRAGLNFYIQEGTLNEKKTFFLTTTGAITLDTTGLTFEEGPTAGSPGGGSTITASRQPVRLATTGNVSLTVSTSPSAVDGVTTSAGDRILVKNQSVASGNGVYVVDTQGAGDTSTWSRATDFDDVSADNIEAGITFYTQEGDTNAGSLHRLITTGTITLGSTSLTFEREDNYTVSRKPVRCATIGNVSLTATAPDTVDGVSLSQWDRILVKDQSTASQNGVYVVETVGGGATGTWIRAGDFDDATEDGIEAGLSFYVQEGDVYGTKTLTLTTTGAITVGSTNTTFQNLGTALVHSVVDIDNSTTTTGETAFSSYTVPADSVQIGDVFRFRSLGDVITIGGTKDSCTIRVRYGGTSGVLLIDQNFSAKGSSDPFSIEGWVQITSLGSKGTIACASRILTRTDASTGSPGTDNMRLDRSATVDTTASQDLTITYEWSASDGSNAATVDSFMVWRESPL